MDFQTGQAIGTVKPSTTTAQVKTQLIAHDKPVHDIAFSKVHNGQDHFATVGMYFLLSLPFLSHHNFYEILALDVP